MCLIGIFGVPVQAAHPGGTSDSEGPEGSQGEIPESEEGLQGGSQEEGRHVKAVRRGNRPGRGMRDSPI